MLPLFSNGFQSTMARSCLGHVRYASSCKSHSQKYLQTFSRKLEHDRLTGRCCSTNVENTCKTATWDKFPRRQLTSSNCLVDLIGNMRLHECSQYLFLSWLTCFSFEFDQRTPFQMGSVFQTMWTHVLTWFSALVDLFTLLCLLCRFLLMVQVAGCVSCLWRMSLRFSSVAIDILRFITQFKAFNRNEDMSMIDAQIDWS